MKLHAEPEPDSAWTHAPPGKMSKKTVIKPFAIPETVPAPVHRDNRYDNRINLIFITQRALQGLRAAETGTHKRHAGAIHY
ncbi:MAG: hypothetical protein A3K90_04915 [Pelodictyon luteolum]|uniref:Uncharacterized protein n=1 Tax=Pelodictyon luteolum TaxID=1100 RepID=A0A165LP80_PELLU|nr:hypothetical protein [Pelodictyon luteolum]KZK74257.1 MAG: hypothetical protein A3K90_04915 [Pelodictyon luteolum]